MKKDNINIKLPNGDIKSYKDKITPLDIIAFFFKDIDISAAISEGVILLGYDLISPLGNLILILFVIINYTYLCNFYTNLKYQYTFYLN